MRIDSSTCRGYLCVTSDPTHGLPIRLLGRVAVQTIISGLSDSSTIVPGGRITTSSFGPVGGERFPAFRQPVDVAPVRAHGVDLVVARRGWKQRRCGARRGTSADSRCVPGHASAGSPFRSSGPARRSRTGRRRARRRPVGPRWETRRRSRCSFRSTKRGGRSAPSALHDVDLRRARPVRGERDLASVGRVGGRGVDRGVVGQARVACRTIGPARRVRCCRRRRRCRPGDGRPAPSRETNSARCRRCRGRPACPRCSSRRRPAGGRATRRRPVRCRPGTRPE